MDDRGVAPALSLFSAAFRLSLPKGEGRVRVSLRWDAAPANSSPPACAVVRRGRQSSRLYERREADQPALSTFRPTSVWR
jgi:hypothetical protein